MNYDKYDPKHGAVCEDAYKIAALSDGTICTATDSIKDLIKSELNASIVKLNTDKISSTDTIETCAVYDELIRGMLNHKK